MNITGRICYGCLDDKTRNYLISIHIYMHICTHIHRHGHENVCHMSDEHSSLIYTEGRTKGHNQ